MDARRIDCVVVYKVDRLSRSLRDSPRDAEPLTREVAGARAVANLILQLVARAERRVAGVLAAELWRPTLPGWDLIVYGSRWSIHPFRWRRWAISY